MNYCVGVGGCGRFTLVDTSFLCVLCATAWMDRFVIHLADLDLADNQMRKEAQAYETKKRKKGKR